MGGKKFVRAGVALVAVLLMIAAIIFAGTPTEPRYQGRTLTQWIHSTPPPRMYSNSGYVPSGQHDPWVAATNAMQQMGPDAIRWLVKWCGTRDSNINYSVIRWLNTHPSLHLKFPLPASQRARAVDGFALLGTNGAPATAALIKKTYDREPGVRLSALVCLENIETPREALFPVVFRLMDDPDSYVRTKATMRENDLETGITLLGDVKGQQLFLSPLLRWINDPDPTVRQHSAKLLHFYFPREAEKAGVYQAFPELRKTATAVNAY